MMHARHLVRALLGRRFLLERPLDVALQVDQNFAGNAEAGDRPRFGWSGAINDQRREPNAQMGAEQPNIGDDLAHHWRDAVRIGDGQIDPAELNDGLFVGHFIPSGELNGKSTLARQWASSSSPSQGEAA